jgi:heat shock protein HslJ
MKTSLPPLAFLGCLVLGPTACQSVGSDGAASGMAPEQGLEGRDWYLAGDGEVPPGVQVTVRFENGRLSGSAGCNRYFAGYSREANGRLRIEMPAATRKYCEGPAMVVERRFLAVLPQVQGFVLSGEGLELSYPGAGKSNVLKFVE